MIEIKFFEKYTGKPIGMYERFLSVEADGSVMEVTEGFSGVTLSNPSDVVYKIMNDGETKVYKCTCGAKYWSMDNYKEHLTNCFEG